MLACFGVALLLGAIHVCGASPLDEPKSDEARLDTGIGVTIVAVVAAVLLAL